jgi:hypothetical protein
MAMPTSPLPSVSGRRRKNLLSLREASAVNPATIEELRDKVFSYLREHPANFAGCARHVGLSRDDVMEFLEFHRDELQSLENEFLDQIEEYVFLASAGLPTPKNFHLATALNILKRKRPESWKEERARTSRRELPQYDDPMSPIVHDIIKGETVEYEDNRTEIVRFANTGRPDLKTLFS